MIYQWEILNFGGFEPDILIIGFQNKDMNSIKKKGKVILGFCFRAVQLMSESEESGDFSEYPRASPPLFFPA